MWNPVVRDAGIPADMKTSYLHLRTYSTVGRGDMTSVKYHDEDQRTAGGIEILFTSPVRYALLFCQGYYTPFPTSPPAEDLKHWVIQRHGYRTVILCNGELVLNITASTVTCDDPDYADTWGTYWKRDATHISFISKQNTASYSFNIGWLLCS